MWNLPSRGRALCAIVSFVVLASCNQGPSPTAPSPPSPPSPVIVSTTSVASVAPASPTLSSTAQSLQISGTGFQPGLVLQVTDPAGVSTTVLSADIQNVVSTSFQALVMLSGAGPHVLVVRQLNGAVSNSFLLQVRDALVSPPTITSVTPSSAARSIEPQLVSLVGTNFYPSLIVQIIDPDGFVNQLNASNLVIDTNSLIEFWTTFRKVGNYTISLWNALGPESESVIVQVR